MFNTISNISRKEDKYGDVHLISLFASTLSRLAYMNDTTFLSTYNSIMGPVFTDKMFTSVNNAIVKSNQQRSSAVLNNLLLNDEELFGLKTWAEMKPFTYVYNGKQYVDFLKLNMPQNINIITNEIKGQLTFPLTPTPPVANAANTTTNVKYISIAWSNYGEVYVVADNRMPNMIMVCWRGTYSAKTTQSYSKPTSVVPLETCKDPNGGKESFLYGIFKLTVEMIHTIVEAATYLATNFLKATQPKSVTIFTTGHSLGGAMCTDFAYLWMGFTKTAPYDAKPYDVFAENIICISLGAPRSMGSSVSQKFCKFVENNKIFYLRVTTRGDPVPGLPPKLGYEHPCSTNEPMRKRISEDCNDHLRTRPSLNVDYQKNLDCQNYKTRAYLPNPLSHTIYLYIKFTGAVDIVNFIKGIGTQKEINRTADGSTVCRIIMGEASGAKLTFYTPTFFNANQARQTPTNVDLIEENDTTVAPIVLAGGRGNGSGGGGLPTKIGGEVAEDVRITQEVFNNLINSMKPFGSTVDKINMLSGTMFAISSTKIMPKLSCPALNFKMGGALNQRRMRTKRRVKRVKSVKRTKRVKRAKHATNNRTRHR